MQRADELVAQPARGVHRRRRPGGIPGWGWVPPRSITTVKATSRSRGSGDPNSAGATPRVPTPRVNLINHINTQTQAQNNPGQLKRVGSCFRSGTAAAAAARSVSLRPSLAQVSPDSSAGEFDGGLGHLHVGAR